MQNMFGIWERYEKDMRKIWGRYEKDIKRNISGICLVGVKLSSGDIIAHDMNYAALTFF